MTSPQHKRATSSVTFCDDLLLTKVHDVQKVESRDRPLVWWTAVDYAHFRSDCQNVIDESRSSSQPQEESWDSVICMRGLEFCEGEHKRNRRDRMKKAVWLVLDEQESNAEEGISDAFAYADMYQQYTNSASLQAQARGAQDEEAVLWDLLDGEDQDSVDNDSTTRLKRRRSSGGKRGSFSSFGISIKGLARRVGSSATGTRVQ